MGGWRGRTAGVLALLVSFVLLATPNAQVRVHSATPDTGGVAADFTALPGVLESTDRRLVLLVSRDGTPPVITRAGGGQHSFHPVVDAARSARRGALPGGLHATASATTPVADAVRTSWWGRAPPRA